MSRPRKIPGSKSVQVSFLLSESEYQAVKQAAMGSNVSMSEWIRRATKTALQVSIDQRKAMMNMTGQQDNTVMDIGVMDNSGATITYSFNANSNPQRASVAIFYQNLVEAGVIAKWWVIAKPDADSP